VDTARLIQDLEKKLDFYGRPNRGGPDVITPLHGYIAELLAAGTVYLAELEKRYLQLSLKDIDLDYAGRQNPTASIHKVLAALEPGDMLSFKAHEDRYLIQDANGHVIGRTAKSFSLDLEIEECEVAAVLVRHSDRCEESFRAYHRSQEWELIVPRIAGRVVMNDTIL